MTTLTPAPAVAHAQTSPAETSRPATKATQRKWWVLVYLASVVSVVISTPTFHAEVNRQLQSTGALAEVKDPGMANLAVNIGILLAILLFMLILALYLSLASVLDRHIFRPRLWANEREPFGLFFIVAAACTVPVHAVCAAFSVAAPKEHAIFYAYVLTVGLAAPFLFRKHWIGLERSKKATLFMASTLLAAASYAA